MRLAFAAILSVALAATCPHADAEQIPQGCFGAAFEFRLAVFRADRVSGVAGSVRECEQVFYRAEVGFVGGTGCCFEGGQLIVSLPDGSSVDVTPDGGLPCFCGESCGAVWQPSFSSQLVPYTVARSDAVGGMLLATATYTAGALKAGADDIPGVPVGLTVQTFPIAVRNTPCIDQCGADPVCQEMCPDRLCTYECGENWPLECFSLAEHFGVEVQCLDYDDFDGFRVPKSPACLDGTCQFVPAPTGTTCDDGNPCTVDDGCQGVTCLGTPASCDDGDVCTFDTCDPDSGCLHARLVPCPADCGNGRLDDGEGCDDGNLLNGDCCSSTCQVEPAETVCRHAMGPCDHEDTCGGAARCPADEKQAAGTVCRSAQTTTCDVDETCDGDRNECPADVFAPNNKPCEDGNFCTESGVCQDGKCRSTVVCDADVRERAIRDYRHGRVVGKITCSAALPQPPSSCAARLFLPEATVEGEVTCRADGTPVVTGGATSFAEIATAEPATFTAARTSEVALRLSADGGAILRRSLRHHAGVTGVGCVVFTAADGTSVAFPRLVTLRRSRR